MSKAYEAYTFVYHNQIRNFKFRYLRAFQVTAVFVKDKELTRFGIGYSGCSVEDLFDEHRGADISTGRAKKNAYEEGNTPRDLWYSTSGYHEKLSKIAENFALKKAKEIESRIAEKKRKQKQKKKKEFNFELKLLTPRIVFD